jgi:glucokinase
MKTPAPLPLSIGIDFGGTSIKPALVQGSQIVRHGTPIDPQAGSAAQTLDAIEQSIRALCEGLPQLVPVGIGFPGLVDSVNGVVHGLSNVPGWVEVPVGQILGERLGVPVILENDANAMAYAEWRYGGAVSARNAVCLTLGTGVGGGLILDGKLFRGSQLAAGEVGQTSIDFRGRRGPYGNLGCLELYVGNQPISERAQAAYEEAALPPPTADCTPRDLHTAALAGCPVANGIWEAVGDELGAAIANIVWLLNPDAIVIGGGVANAADVLFPHINRSVRSRCSDVVTNHLRIVAATLGNNAGAIGCAALALENAAAVR